MFPEQIPPAIFIQIGKKWNHRWTQINADKNKKCHSEAKPKNLGVKDETLHFIQGDCVAVICVIAVQNLCNLRSKIWLILVKF